MDEFEVVGALRDAQTIASGRSIRDLARLRRTYGRGRWRKRKAFAIVRLADGFVYENVPAFFEPGPARLTVDIVR